MELNICSLQARLYEQLEKQALNCGQNKWTQYLGSSKTLPLN